jgi:ankyrin repeat protein
MNKIIRFLCLNALVMSSALLAMNSDQNGQNADQGEELRYAASAGNLELVQELLARHVPVDAKSNYGQTALIQAASYGRKEVCQLLIDAKARINTKDSFGLTALMAAAYGYKEVCQLLVDAMLKPIKENRAAAIALLGLKKFNKAACMSQNDRNIIQLIAHQIYNPATIQQLFAQINAIKSENLKEDLVTYALEQLNPKMDPNTNQGTSHE